MPKFQVEVSFAAHGYINVEAPTAGEASAKVCKIQANLDLRGYSWPTVDTSLCDSECNKRIERVVCVED